MAVTYRTLDIDAKRQSLTDNLRALEMGHFMKTREAALWLSLPANSRVSAERRQAERAKTDIEVELLEAQILQLQAALDALV